jgi:poly(3-hydroxybutyrate) depolymerase
MSAMRSGADASTRSSKRTGASRPTIVFHGDRDVVVHPSNARGFLTDLDPGPGATVSFPQSGTSGGRDFIRTEYRSGAGAVMLENWDVHGSGHAWSGGSSAGSFSDPAGPDASREMMRFFLERKRSVLARTRGALRPN